MGEEAAEKAWGTWYTNYAGSIDTTALHMAFIAGRASVHDTFDGLRSRIAALEAVIRAALRFDGQQTVDGVTDRGYLSPEEWREGKIAAILEMAPSVVLDQVIREAKAEALDEAANTYRSGQLTGIFMGRDDYPRAWMAARADKIRNGDA